MRKSLSQPKNRPDRVDDFIERSYGGDRAHIPPEVNVRSIRKGLHMTQTKFSTTFGFSHEAVKHWENGTRRPLSATRAFLTVISKHPDIVIAALHPAIANNPRRGRNSTRQTVTFGT